MLRNITLGIIMATMGLVGTNKVNAQAFEKGGTYLNLGLGASNFWHIDVQNNWPGYGGWRGSNVGGITLQMEWGIHQYVGLGFATGVQGGIGRHAWYGPGNNYGELAVPFGLIVNFHFYQLIEDKTSKDIHGDKLDIYAGLNVGSGISYFPRPNWITPLFFAGPQVGAKYYVAPKVALGLELGWGKTYVNGGVTFKL